MSITEHSDETHEHGMEQEYRCSCGADISIWAHFHDGLCEDCILSPFQRGKLDGFRHWPGIRAWFIGSGD